MALLTVPLMWTLVLVPVMFVLYLVIRSGVRDGTIAAQRQLDRDRVRAELGVGREASPNTGRPRTPPTHQETT